MQERTYMKFAAAGINKNLKKIIKMEKTLQISFDWASNKHAYSWYESDHGQEEHGQVAAKPELFKAWWSRLRARFSEHHFEVIVEMSKGALIWMIKDYEYVTVYPFNPICSKNFRKACTSSGAKDDPSDAALWLEYLRKHHSHLRAYKATSEHCRQLDLLTTHRRGFIDQQTSLLQQLQCLLNEYYPQALELIRDLRSPMALAFLRRWPDPHQLMSIRSSTLEGFYRRHKLRRADCILKRLEILHAITPLTDDRVIIQSCVLRLNGLLDQLEVLTKTIAGYDQRIEELIEQSDPRRRALIESLPRTGKALGPRMLVALDYLACLDTPEAAAAFSGVAPVTVRSGKSWVVHRRHGRPRFLHQTLVEFAQQSTMTEGWARNYYLVRKEKGEAYFSIMRSLAYKWLRILLKCWENNVPYNESLYCNALISRGSPYAPNN